MRSGRERSRANPGRWGNRIGPLPAAGQRPDGGPAAAERGGRPAAGGSRSHPRAATPRSAWRWPAGWPARVDGEPLDWGSLSIADLDALVLRLRQALIGDRVLADVACPAPSAAGASTSTSASRISSPTMPREAARTKDRRLDPRTGRRARMVPAVPGVGGLAARRPPGCPPRGADQVRFRLPTAADLLAVAGQPAAEQELAARCLQPADLPARLRGTRKPRWRRWPPACPATCRASAPSAAAPVTLQFDARWFCLRELRDRAAFVYQDVDLLARRYHWSETEILAMPQARRAAYAELARQDGGA